MESMEDYKDLYEASFKKFRVGDIVKGLSLIHISTDVVNDDIKEALKNVAMQIAALHPQYVCDSEVPEEDVYKRQLTHNMENVFSEIRNDKMKVTASLIDTLFQCLDALESYLNNIQEASDEGTEDNEAIIKLLNEFLATEGNMTTEAQPAPTAQPEQAAPAAGSASGNAKYKDCLLYTSGNIQKKKQDIGAIEQEADSADEEANEIRKPENVTSLLQVDPIELEFGYGIIPLADANQGGDLLIITTRSRRSPP